MYTESQGARTLFDKIWDSHVVADLGGGAVLLYVDRHLLHEVTSAQAFEGLRNSNRQVRMTNATVAVADHNVPTEQRRGGVAAIQDPESRLQVETLERNVAAFEVPYIPLASVSQGIVHIIGPELGLTLPGTTLVCGDSHTSTHGAFGTFAFGIGTSEVEHVLATQTIIQHRPKVMMVKVTGQLGKSVTAKDLALYIIRVMGSDGAAGHVIEYSGDTVSALDMAGRMTLCNMSIEAGARAGLIAPDEVTYAWIENRPLAPQGLAFAKARIYWDTLQTDRGATFDSVVCIDASKVVPVVTWGTTPDTSVDIGSSIPDSPLTSAANKRAQSQAMLDYMGLAPGTPIEGLAIDVVFIGSCTNGRIEDLRAAAAIVGEARVAPNVRALVVPGSGIVKAQAEAEGLDKVFLQAGFEWRDPGCSMCLGMNPDQLRPGQRCASTSNRNFEGRQGVGGRTHLMSPAMAAAAAIAGRIVDVRGRDK